MFTLSLVLTLSPVRAAQPDLSHAGKAAGAAPAAASFSRFAIRFPHIELPEIDLSDIDKEAEKEKLREALKTMEEMGISPGKLLRRAWSFLTRQENREKLKKAAENAGHAVSAGKESLHRAAEEVAPGASDALDKAADETAKKLSDKASEQIDKAADTAAEKAKEKAAEELKKAGQSLQ